MSDLKALHEAATSYECRLCCGDGGYHDEDEALREAGLVERNEVDAFVTDHPLPDYSDDDYDKAIAHAQRSFSPDEYEGLMGHIEAIKAHAENCHGRLLNRLWDERHAPPMVERARYDALEEKVKRADALADAVAAQGDNHEVTLNDLAAYRQLRDPAEVSTEYQQESAPDATDTCPTCGGAKGERRRLRAKTSYGECEKNCDDSFHDDDPDHALICDTYDEDDECGHQQRMADMQADQDCEAARDREAGVEGMGHE